jgi:hypothetical protein
LAVASVDDSIIVAGSWHDSTMGVSMEVPVLVGYKAVR